VTGRATAAQASEGLCDHHGVAFAVNQLCNRVFSSHSENWGANPCAAKLTALRRLSSTRLDKLLGAYLSYPHWALLQHLLAGLPSTLQARALAAATPSGEFAASGALRNGLLPAIATVLQATAHLTALDVSRNGAGPADMVPLAGAVESMTALTRLDVSFNRFEGAAPCAC
jgi:hypothetical protein